ncbi:hypothetical protein [Streptomyces sp. NPDC089799]|uniref:Rv1733c family protein n=1 Tax=Streptomyces sp. NPDC089799 TaxID=3155066 RepID=UPI00342B5FA2
MRMATGVWRWRRNPLRRRTDMIEAWVALAALVCLFVVAPAIGWISGLSVDATLQRAVREQRQERHLVPAVVVRAVNGTAPGPGPLQVSQRQEPHRPRQQTPQRGPEEMPEGEHVTQQALRQEPRQGPQRTRILAAWTAPDGSAHQGAVPAAEEPPRPGDRFRMWTDGGGRPVARPLDPSTAALHAGLVGLAAALAVAALVETVRRMVLRRLVHRRYQRLDRAWAVVGPDWGRAGAGS